MNIEYEPYGIVLEYAASFQRDGRQQKTTARAAWA